MSIESRRQPRREIPGMVDVFDTITEQTIGQLGNVSAGGMLLIANRSLPEGALFQFRFVLPDADAQPAEVGAEVMWQAAAGAPGQSWVGLRFIDLSQATARRLRRFAEPAASAE